jgi:hypothetical protein
MAWLSDRYKNNSSNQEERKGYLARNKGTRLLKKETRESHEQPGLQQKNK